MINIQVDVDNLWIYEKEFNIKIHPNREYIYLQGLPIFLDLLKKSKSKATFMIIGQDLKLQAAQIFCKKAIAQGHEIANHTWSHPISFGTLSFEQKNKEIIKAHEQIKKICGKAPVGFRGPGYYQDMDIITILEKLNYQYDASVLPGLAQFFMTAYAYMRDGENRHKTFGRVNYCLSKNQPYIIKTSLNKKLLELPISVLPIIKIPIHTTFAYYLGPLYRKLIFKFIKSKPEYMLYLFHAIDFVDLPRQNNHPAIPLQYDFKERMSFIENILKILVRSNNGPLQTSRNNIRLTNRH